MEVESEDEDDERQERSHGQHSQPDQDTQVQDMDEVRAKEIPRRRLPQTARALNYNLPSFPNALLFLQGSDEDDDGMKVPLPPDNPMPPPLPPTPDQVIIRKDYDPKGRMCSLR